MPYFNSTAIARAEYDAKSQELTIWFRDGRHPYPYFRVPLNVYQGLLAASSKGTYFARFIEPIYGYRV